MLGNTTAIVSVTAAPLYHSVKLQQICTVQQQRRCLTTKPGATCIYIHIYTSSPPPLSPQCGHDGAVSVLLDAALSHCSSPLEAVSTAGPPLAQGGGASHSVSYHHRTLHLRRVRRCLLWDVGRRPVRGDGGEGRV